MDDKGGDMRNCEQEILCCFASTGCDTERNRFDTWVRGCDCPCDEFTPEERAAGLRALERRGIFESYFCPKRGCVMWRRTGKGSMRSPAKLELDS
jgi:hypothetical protein